MRILLIEDDIDLAATIADFMATRQVTVDHAYDGITGLELATTTKPDAVVLDVGLPGLDGYRLCESLRQQWKMQVPVIMLTARGTLADKLEGFR
ncbi:MAG: response regulator, partial [Verrucomicrobiota bacterium]